MHGQHDDRGLLNPKGHRALLDAFGKLDTGPIAAAWSEVARIEGELGQARAEALAAERDREYLEHACGEIEQLAPAPGEETELAEQRAAMQAGIKAGESWPASTICSAGRMARLRRFVRRRAGSSAAPPTIRCSPKRWRRSTGR